jgi:hypothetical protein
MAGGLYHPNCKDIHTTYFEGISTPPKPMTNAEKREAERVYYLEQRQRYNERQIRKYKRLSTGSIDPDNQAKYQEKLEMWQNHQKKFVKANSDVLKRRYENESTLGIGPIDNVDTRKTVERMRREVEIEKLKKVVDKSKNSGIMDLDTSTMRSVNGVEIGDPMPQKQFERIQKAAERRGIALISNEDSERYVLDRGAEAITLNAQTVCLMRNPSRVAVFEELIHVTQYRLGQIDGTPLSIAKGEVAAKEKLLKHAKAYGLTDIEIKNTEILLASDRQVLEELMKGG